VTHVLNQNVFQSSVQLGLVYQADVLAQAELTADVGGYLAMDGVLFVRVVEHECSFQQFVLHAAGQTHSLLHVRGDVGLLLACNLQDRITARHVHVPLNAVYRQIE